MSYSVKIIKQTETAVTVGGYGVVFGGIDLEGETFTPDTRFMMDLVPTKLVLYDHAAHDNVKHALGDVSNEAIKTDETGLWIEAQLDRSRAYVNEVIKLIESGALGWSSGSIGHLTQRDGKNITQWPIVEFSLTPTPAEPRTLGVDIIKALSAIHPTLKAFLPKAKKETASAKATGESERAKDENKTKESNMSDEKKDTDTAPQVDLSPVLDAVKALGERFNTVEARVDEVEKQPATKAAGFAVDVEVTKDEEDKEPQKGLGEFLQLVSQGDPRELRKYQSDEKGLVGYYDLTKAVGQKTVDRIAHAVKGTKAAPTGLGELVPSGGGFLVGTDMPGGVLGRDHNVGQILSRVDITPISANSNAMTFNAEDETSRANGSRRGGIRAFWAAEASAKTASQPKFRQMELKLNKVIGLVYATDELLADASALEAWIMQNLPEELRFVVEDAIYRGTGAGQPLGILNSNCLVSVAKETGQAATTILSENVIKMWARRWLGGRDYVWFVNQDTMPQLMQMSLAVGTGGNLTYLPPGGLSGSPFGSLMARPVIEVEYAATLGTVGDIVLVDLGQYQAIDKGGIQSASSIHVRFVNDETVFRFVYRFDGQPKWDAALTPFQGSNTVSPFVALATRA